MIRCGSVHTAQFMLGEGIINDALVCLDSLAALAVSMRIYGDSSSLTDRLSDEQADSAAKTKRADSHFACRKKVERIGPADGFGLRR